MGRNHEYRRSNDSASPTVAHNCHGKTKSHGTTNLTHGKTVLSDGKTKLIQGSTQLIHGSTQLIHGKTKLTHGRTHLTHAKTKFTHFSPFFSRPARLFALAFGNEVRAGTHSRRLRRLLPPPKVTTAITSKSRSEDEKKSVSFAGSVNS